MDLLVSAVAACTGASLWYLYALTQVGFEALLVSLRPYSLEAMVRYCTAVIAVPRERKSSKTARRLLASRFRSLNLFEIRLNNFFVVLLDLSWDLFLRLNSLFSLGLLLLLSLFVLLLFVLRSSHWLC